MPRRKKPAPFVPRTDLFEIPRTVDEARRVARAIGAPLTAGRYRSIAAAERAAAKYLRRRTREAARAERERLADQRAIERRERIEQRQFERQIRETVPLTAREREQRGAQRVAAAEQLAYQRLRTLIDTIDAGAPPATIVRLARDWDLDPDLWWQYARAAWAEHDDWQDVTSSQVYGSVRGSPSHVALPES